jgi:cell division septum initiation protein DivIVA
MERMAHGGDLFAMGEAAPMNLGFELVIRGYDKRQVGAYVEQAEAEITALAAERDEALRQAQALANETEMLRAEAAETRGRSPITEATSFRHLGHRVEQILGLAEDQAASIVRGAHQSVRDIRVEAERLLAEAQAERSNAVRDFEVALAARRGEEDESATARRDALQAEIAAAEAYVVQRRKEIDSEAQSAHQQTTATTAEAIAAGALALDEAQRKAQQVMAQAIAHAERVKTEATMYAQSARSEADTYMQQQRRAVDAEVAERRTAAEGEVGALRTETERYAVTTRGQAEDAARKASDAVRAESEAMLGAARAQAERIIAEANRAATATHQQAAAAEQKAHAYREQAAASYEQAQDSARQLEAARVELAAAQDEAAGALKRAKAARVEATAADQQAAVAREQTDAARQEAVAAARAALAVRAEAEHGQSTTQPMSALDAAGDSPTMVIPVGAYVAQPDVDGPDDDADDKTITLTKPSSGNGSTAAKMANGTDAKAKSVEATSADAAAGDAKTADAKAGETRVGDAAAADAKTATAKATDVKSDEANKGDDSDKGDGSDEATIAIKQGEPVSAGRNRK